MKSKTKKRLAPLLFVLKWAVAIALSAYAILHGAFWQLMAIAGILIVGAVGAQVAMEVKLLRLTLETLRCPLCGAPFDKPQKKAKEKDDEEVVQ